MNKKPEKIFISWIGKNDISAMNNKIQERGLRGAIRTVTDEYDFDRIYLLYTVNGIYEENKEKIKEWVSQGTKAEITLLSMGNINDPAKFSEVYPEMKKFFHQYYLPPEQAVFSYALTSGTPAMYAAFVFLSPEFPGEFLRTVTPKQAASGQYILKDDFPFLLSSASLPKIFADNLTITQANRQVFEEVLDKVALVTGASVLILGESGVGKSCLAREIHKKSLLPQDKYREVNCAELAISPDLFRSELFGYKKGAFTGANNDKKGIFEEVDGGTLFLDEIGEIPLNMQAMLLKVLQNGEIQPLGFAGKPKKITVRIIAATNKDLMEEVRCGRFRADLFYRLSDYIAELASLRDVIRSNPEDINKLLASCIDQIRKSHPILNVNIFLPQNVCDIIASYSWPGNLRELKQYLLRVIMLSHDPVHISEGEMLRYLPKRKEQREGAETAQQYPIFSTEYSMEDWLLEKAKDFVEKAMEKSKGKKADAARLLGITYQKLDYFLTKNGLDK